MAGRHTQRRRRRKRRYKINWLNMFLFFLIVFLLAIVAIAGIIMLTGDKLPAPSDEEGGEVEIQVPENINPLTGLHADTYINPIVVMISNIREARPQTGLYKANIAYEIEMEGQITRFVSLFYGDPPETAGPVRSARPYVMRYGMEYDAWFVHVGGSEDGKAYAKNTSGFKDVEGLYVTQGFVLDSTRKRPHNTYANLTGILEGRAESGKIPELLFKDDDGTPAYCTLIKLDYGKSNRIEYRWDESRRSYARYLNDEPHTDRVTGEQIYTPNVIIQYAKHIFSGDALGHIEVKNVGSGKAEYYLGGQYFTGTWKKDSDSAFTQYYDESGNEIKRARGNTIVQVVRDNKKMIGDGHDQTAN